MDTKEAWEYKKKYEDSQRNCSAYGEAIKTLEIKIKERPLKEQVQIFSEKNMQLMAENFTLNKQIEQMTDYIFDLTSNFTTKDSIKEYFEKGE